MVGHMDFHYYTRCPQFDLEDWNEGTVRFVVKEGYTFEVGVVVGIEDLERIEEMIHNYRKRAGLLDESEADTNRAAVAAGR